MYICTYTLLLAFELDICSGNGKTVGKITAASLIYCKHNSSLMTWLWPSSPVPFNKTLAQPWWMKPQKTLAFPIKSWQMACQTLFFAIKKPNKMSKIKSNTFGLHHYSLDIFVKWDNTKTFNIFWCNLVIV